MNLSFESLSESANKKQSSSKIFHPTVVSTKNMSLNFAALKSPVCRTAVKCTPQSSVHSSGTKMVVSVRKSLNTSVKVTGSMYKLLRALMDKGCLMTFFQVALIVFV